MSEAVEARRFLWGGSSNSSSLPDSSSATMGDFDCNIDARRFLLEPGGENSSSSSASSSSLVSLSSRMPLRLELVCNDWFSFCSFLPWVLLLFWSASASSSSSSASSSSSSSASASSSTTTSSSSSSSSTSFAASFCRNIWYNLGFSFVIVLRYKSRMSVRILF